jgi:hypothetical protein
MENIYYLIITGLIFWYFIHLRQVSEFALKYTKNYCEKDKLQFISIARRSTRIKYNNKRGIYFYSIFDFEFSSDGDSCYQGVVSLNGLKLNDFVLPTYRI